MFWIALFALVHLHQPIVVQAGPHAYHHGAHSKGGCHIDAECPGTTVCDKTDMTCDCPKEEPEVCMKACGGVCNDPLETCDQRIDQCVCGQDTMRDNGTGECLPKRHYGEDCKMDMQCVDSLQVCNQTTTKCDCRSGHDYVYNATTNQCMMPQYTYVGVGMPFRIMSAASTDIALEIQGGNVVAGTLIKTAIYDASLHQMWSYDGTFIRSLADPSLYLDKTSGDWDVIVAEFTGSDTQKWTLHPDKTITINDNGHALDIEGGGLVPNNQLIVFPKHGNGNQIFNIVVVFTE